MRNRPLALFDMDQTLCDYKKALIASVRRLESPLEKRHLIDWVDAPEYIKERMRVVRSSISWWENLPRLKTGWDVLEMARENDYDMMVLTQGSKTIPEAWTGKKRWIDREMGSHTDVTMTHDKSLIWGDLLVDDFPGYVDSWLNVYPGGQVIMPAHQGNHGYEHPRVIRYDGSNQRQVRQKIEEIAERFKK